MSELTAEMIERGRGADPEKAAKRRKLASQVRATREKLTSSGTGHRAFDLELLRLFAQSRKSSVPVILVLALSVSVTAANWVPLQSVLIWLTLVASAAALNFGLASRFLGLTEAQADTRKTKRKFVAGEMVEGFAWSSLVLVLMNVPDPDARTFVLFVLLLIAALTAMVCASIPSAVYIGLLPITLGIIFFMQPLVEYRELPLTIMATGAQLYFIVLANRLYTTTLASLSFRMDKELLIAELEQQKANSDEARRRAEEANLAKSRFLATMSHELRTPLNAILGFSEVMKGELFGVHSIPSYKEYSTDIHSSGEHLLMLINEILDLSRVEAGRYELKEESVSLPNLVEDCRHLMGIRAKKRDITITEATEPGLPRIWADERAVRQVVLNLLSNAIKFTPQGGAITIKVGWTQAGGQYLSIRDTGPGIPASEIPIVMSSFGRGTLAQKNADEGSGLGLPIVKGLVELHGGTFTLNSKVREGTEVIVVFPPERIMDALPQLHPDETDPPAAPRQRTAARNAA